MNFSENTNLLPGGQSASPSKLKELDNKIDDLAQTVTSVADSVADLADEVTTAELNATSANVTNAVIDNATVGTETATTVNATTANADTLNATDADITNLTADDVEANSVDADNGYFGSVNAQSFTGQSVNITGDITASAKVQGKTVQATEKVVTPALESTETELKGNTTVRGDVYFPENGDKIYGEYLEIEADKVKVKSLTTEIPGVTNNLVGYDANGNLIPVDAAQDPSVLWQDKTGDITTIVPRNDKKVEATKITTPTLNADEVNATNINIRNEVSCGTISSSYDITTQADFVADGGIYVAKDAQIRNDLNVDGDTTLDDTTVDGTLQVNGDIIQNGSAYETHAEKVYSKNDLIITRDGAVSGLSTGQYTGIQAKKYDGTNDGQLVFDKDGEARVGDVGDTEPLMTRDELADMTNGSLLQWDGTNKKAVCGKSADIIPSDASTSNKLITTNAVNTALAGYMPTKAFVSPNGSMQYIKIECNASFGGILLAFDYSAIYSISSEGVINLSNNEYGLSGVAISTGKKIIYLKIGGYRRYSITNLSKSPAITISDATTTAPSGFTFTTDWEMIATKSDVNKCPQITHLTLGTTRTASFTMIPAHSYRLTCGHPTENNKSGLYTIYCASEITSKVENLTSQNNYTITVSGLVATITATSNYGLITVEDLGNYNP